jgi:hypothetical protein
LRRGRWPICEWEGGVGLVAFGLTYKRISTREDDESIISLPILLDQLCDIIPFYESASPLFILKWTKIEVWAQETKTK